MRRDELERPDYLLLLGDLHQVPESIHRVLMQSGCFVGRLAFSRPDGAPDLDAYRRYAEKLVAAERTPRRPAAAPVRALAVADGSAATELGARQLVRPLLERARLVGARFKTGDVNDPDACAVHDRDALWQTAAGLAYMQKYSVLGRVQDGKATMDSLTGTVSGTVNTGGLGALILMAWSCRHPPCR